MNPAGMQAEPAKVLIMAGGTGGHIYPALTIAGELRHRGMTVEWLGTRKGLEARVIGATDIPLHFINVSGLRGKSLSRLLLAPFVIGGAVIQALRIIRRVRPDCVLGMGGFATGPGGLAARLLGRKLLIHEQNAVAGLTNQLLCPLADIVMEAFAGAFVRKRGISPALLKLFINPARPVVVGNPVRADILALAAPAQRLAGRTGKLRLLVLGGSLGATAINRVIGASLQLLPVETRPLVRHQCGSRNVEETQKAYAEAGLEASPEVELLPYIDDMTGAYDWADLVLCRAGASTIAELAAIGLPSILIPFPHAVDDHQTANARLLEQAGAACIIPQAELQPQLLAGLIQELGRDRERLLRQAVAAREAGIRDAGTRAAAFCQELCHV